jgi:hypothetical protein
VNPTYYFWSTGKYARYKGADEDVCHPQWLTRLFRFGTTLKQAGYWPIMERGWETRIGAED